MLQDHTFLLFWVACNNTTHIDSTQRANWKIWQHFLCKSSSLTTFFAWHEIWNVLFRILYIIFVVVVFISFCQWCHCMYVRTAAMWSIFLLNIKNYLWHKKKKSCLVRNSVIGFWSNIKSLCRIYFAFFAYFNRRLDVMKAFLTI